MRVLLDTNIWISALIFGGNVSQILLLAEAGRITLIASEATLNELNQVLSRQKFKSRIRELNYTQNDLMQIVYRLIKICPTPKIEVPDLRDPKDLIILSTAVGGYVDVIISGDQDLLVLGSFLEIPILSPKTFLDRYFSA